MFSQKLRHVEDDELRIDIDPCYEADPYELKLDEMIDAEPEPEVIEGLPASDALTPADRYLELFTNVQKSRIFADSKPSRLRAETRSAGHPAELPQGQTPARLRSAAVR